VSEVTIREADASDAPAFMALRARWAAEQRGDGQDAGFAERFGAWFAVELQRRVFWLAEAGDAPVGMVNVLVFDRMPTPGRDAGGWGYLGNLFVVAEHRGRGTGGRLVGAVIDHARAAGFVRVVLSPSERSVPLYRRAGFVPADRLLVLPLA
jgi:GNAT superfamily N-acetyltransferase